MAGKTIQDVLRESLRALGKCRRCGAPFEGPIVDGSVVYWPVPNSEKVTGIALCNECSPMVIVYIESGPNAVIVIEEPAGD